MGEPKRTGAVSLKIATNACRSLPSSLVCFFKGFEQVKQGLEQVKQVFQIFLFLRYKTNKTSKNKWLNAEMIVY